MTDKTINALTAVTSAVAADEIPIWVAGSAVTRKITRSNFLTGYGALATANIWTAAQTVVGASVGARVASTGNGQAVRHVGALRTSSIALANGAAVTLTFGGEGILIVLEVGYATLLFATYANATIIELADVDSVVPAVLTVTKVANSNQIVITNVSGVTRNIGVHALGVISAVT